MKPQISVKQGWYIPSETSERHVEVVSVQLFQNESLPRLYIVNFAMLVAWLNEKPLMGSMKTKA